MSGEGGPSRRQLLRRLAGVGAVGATAGVGTRALVAESESFVTNSLQSRSLDLELAYDVMDGRLDTQTSLWTPSEIEFGDSTGLSVDLGELTPETPVSLAFGLRSSPCDLPVELWMRVAGEGDSTLASAVRMRVVHQHDECGTLDGYDWCGTVEDVRSGSTASETSDCADLSELSTGVRLASGCTGTGDGCSPTCLSAEWWIPDEADTSSLSEGTLSLSFEFVGRQCTSQQSTGGNPWNP